MARRSRRAAAEDAPPSDEAGRIVEATLALIANEGWRRLTLAAVANEAGVPILRVYRLFGSKPAILGAFFRRIDEAVLAEPPAAEADERPRDRLFDLLMRRFDALTPYKAAIAALSRELPLDPAAALQAGTSLLRSLRWMLEAADISTAGLSGAVAVRLVAGAYLATMRVWQRDDSPDLARTMSTLDARLRRIERWLQPAYQPPRAAPA
ncbi:MAG TPA: helix-turn-helix domain-containing protein [Stellaceae bacterium]|nr:helix-turn-helix domain-containing protein [Stellaceae bacterium]